MIWLPDGNVLIAVSLKGHADHVRCVNWLDGITDRFATCAVTQGTLLRLHMCLAKDKSTVAAWTALAGVEPHPLHDDWDDDLHYGLVPHRQIQGHRQVTDAWLVELARRNGAKVAALDKGMVATYPGDAVLI